MPKEIVDNVELDGSPQLNFTLRPSMKLAGAPNIILAFPIGDKRRDTVFTCPEEAGGCGKSFREIGHYYPHLVPFQLWVYLQMVKPPFNTLVQVLGESGRRSGEARQIMTKEAIRSGAEYIVYWDDDTLPPGDALRLMYDFMSKNPEAGAVSAVVTDRVNPNSPMIVLEHGKGPGWDFPMGPGAEPVPIFGAGAGLIMARLSAVQDVIEKLEAENGFEVPVWADANFLPTDEEAANPNAEFGEKMVRHMGHDIRFTYLLNKYGHQVYAHGGILCGHLDMESNEVFYVPEDAPGLRMQRTKNINTQDLWDTLYGREGVNSWRQYPEMFQKVEDEIDEECEQIVELGCGVGILGTRLTAKYGLKWKGYDISETAVEYCKARFLEAERMDLADLHSGHFPDGCTVIATEVLEHLDEADFFVVMNVAMSSAKKFIFTTPNNCMGPDEEPQHTALFNPELIAERLNEFVETGYTLTIEPADNVHLIAVLERPSGSS